MDILEESWSWLRDVATYLSLLTEPWLATWTYMRLERAPGPKFPKRVILIRHPHTNEEVDKVYRAEYARITPKGREQAHTVARRIADTGGVTHIVTSTLPRSRRLAKLIGRTISAIERLPVVIESDLFVEVRKPRELTFVHRDDPRAKQIGKRLKRLFDFQYRFSDEENRWRLEVRVWRALRMLAALEGENVVVVTHGKFLRAIWHYLYEGGTLEGFYRKADRILKHDNTGVTILRLEPSFRSGTLQWNAESWNDISHTEVFVPTHILRDLAARP